MVKNEILVKIVITTELNQIELIFAPHALCASTPLPTLTSKVLLCQSPRAFLRAEGHRGGLVTEESAQQSAGGLRVTGAHSRLHCSNPAASAL